MAIEFPCSSCSSTLRVPDEYAGKQAKCPRCASINVVPLSSISENATTENPEAINPVPGIDAPVVTENKVSEVSPEAFAIATPKSQNPYAAGSDFSPVQTSGGLPVSQVFKPLYDAIFFIDFLAWFFIIVGILYCITIFGLIVGWLPLWIGICLKNASASLKQGYRTGNIQQLYNVSSNLATIAKIVGILYMISILLFVLYICLIILLVGVGAFSAASSGGF